MLYPGAVMGAQSLSAPNSGCLCLNLGSTTEEHLVLGQFN